MSDLRSHFRRAIHATVPPRGWELLRQRADRPGNGDVQVPLTAAELVVREELIQLLTSEAYR